MAGSAGSIGQFFPDIFGGGAPMSAAGSAATTSAATGAGSMALGPWMAASAGIQGLAGIAGGLMGQQSAREAQAEANKNTTRGWGYDMFSRDREKASQMAALREGNYFMQSPIFQQNQGQDFRQNFMLSGKFNPYLTGIADRFS
jgi:hypothetical protein